MKKYTIIGLIGLLSHIASATEEKCLSPLPDLKRAQCYLDVGKEYLESGRNFKSVDLFKKGLEVIKPTYKNFKNRKNKQPLRDDTSLSLLLAKSYEDEGKQKKSALTYQGALESRLMMIKNSE